MCKVSVVMSVYNAERYLEEAIESILNQTYQDFEFIIINDGSTDSSLDLINKYNDKRIRLIDQENKGLSKSLNTGISSAKGIYIARMDADDISFPQRIETQLEFLEKNADYVVIGSNAKIIDAEGNFLYSSNLPITWPSIKNFLPESPLFHSSAMFRKSAWAKAGGYFEEVVHHFEDKILWNRMTAYGKIRNIEEPLIAYRLVPSSISNKPATIIYQLREICNKIILTNSIGQDELQNLIQLSRVGKTEQITNYYLRLSSIYLNKNRNIFKAFANTFKALINSPLEKQAWLGILYCCIPYSLYKFLKKTRT